MSARNEANRADEWRSTVRILLVAGLVGEKRAATWLKRAARSQPRLDEEAALAVGLLAQAGDAINLLSLRVAEAQIDLVACVQPGTPPCRKY